ncbi:MAG: SRPBCC family protein [Myxococcota bacterium]
MTKPLSLSLRSFALGSALLVPLACDPSSPAEAMPAAPAATQEKAETPAKAEPATPVDAALAKASTAAVTKFESSGIAAAPMRVQVKARLDAAPDEVWAYVSDNGNLQEYAASVGVKHVEIDDSKADANGVGVVRECTAMGDENIVEEIVYAEAPYVFGYSAVQNPLGMTDHTGVIIVRPAAGGTTELEWRQYFNAADPSNETSMAIKTKIMTTGLLAFFTNKYGGEVVS